MRRGPLWVALSALLTVVCTFDICQAVADSAGHAVGQRPRRVVEDRGRHTGKAFDDVGPEKGKGKYREDELLVKFKPDVPEHRKDALHKKHGSQKIKEFARLRLQKVKLPKGAKLEKLHKRYQADPDVEYAEPNYLLQVQATPNDPRLGELWGLNNTGQTGGSADADIDAPEAWNLATGSSSVVVGIIDTGVDSNHQDLAANIWVNPGEIPGDGIDNDGNGYVDDIHGIDTVNHDSDPMDDYGHGSHVAGTIGAKGNNGVGIAGINWYVRIAACKFLDDAGSGSTDGAIECLEYFRDLRDRGINIVVTNNSWGGGDNSQALYDAINGQRDPDPAKSILFCAAAGNESLDNDRYGFYPARFSLPNLIAVAATDSKDALAEFSNYGRRRVHVGAPGVDILSTIPGNGYALYSGTSMATPHVAGLAALLKAQDPNRNWSALKNLIISGGDQIAALNGKTVSGRRINAPGSITCSNRPLFSILALPGSVAAGVASTLTALSIDCAAPVGPVVVETEAGQRVSLFDDGVAPDLAADDGIFTGNWTPEGAGDLLTFRSPLGSESAALPLLSITTARLPEPNFYSDYHQTLSADGGVPPYTWRVTENTLPRGLALNGLTGEISGRPTEAVTVSPMFEVTDALNQKASRYLTFMVPENDGAPIEAWFRSYGVNSIGSGLVFDPDGNFYQSGGVWNADWDFLLAKYDASGTLLWSKVYDTGFSNGANGLARGAAGNLYLAGFTENENDQDFLTAKFDAQGNLLWTKTFDGGKDDYATSVAVGSDGSVYVAGYSYEGTVMRGLLIKYDPAGNEVWSRIRNGGYGDSFNGIAVDGGGSVYIAGSTKPGSDFNQLDLLIAKYDPSGALIWSKNYDEAGLEGGISVAVDALGQPHVFASKWTPMGANSYSTAGIVVKFDANGNALWSRTNGDDPGGFSGALILDAGGNVYVTGSGFHNSRLVNTTVKFDAAGTQLWKKHSEGGASFEPIGQAIALDHAGNVHVTGLNKGYAGAVAATVDAFTIKYVAPLKLETTALDRPTAGIPYAAALNATGGSPSYRWSLLSGTLPEGLALDPDAGIVSGTAVRPSSTYFTIGLTDAAGVSASRQFSLYVYGIKTTGFPSANVGSYYGLSLVAAGGDESYLWSLPTGSTLPPGLTLTSNGYVSGTPSAAGSFSFSIQAKDSSNRIATKSFIMEVHGGNLAVTTSSLPNGSPGTAYSQTLAATGGLPPYSWSLVSGTLPAGLSLNPGTGAVAGTPTAEVVADLVVQVTDSSASPISSTRPLTLTVVYGYLTVRALSQAPIMVGKPCSRTLEGSGGKAPYRWSVSGLPDGLSVDAGTGVISGTATFSGTFPIIVKITDARGISTTIGVTLRVFEWSAFYDSAGFDAGAEIAIGADGTVHLAGQSRNGSNNDYLVLKYGLDGSLLWSRSYDGGGDDAANGVVVDIVGNVYVTGTANYGSCVTIKYSPGGDPLWTRSYSGTNSKRCNNLALDAGGNLVVAGLSYEGSNSSALLIKYDGSGNQLWSQTYPTTGVSNSLQAVTLDSGGNIYAAGESAGSIPETYLTLKYDPSGSLVWAKTYRKGSWSYATGIVADAGGNVYVSGRSSDTSSSCFTIKYDSAGNALWTKGLCTGFAWPHDLAIDASGYLYVSGMSGYDYLVVKADSSGNVIWTKSYDFGGNDEAFGVAVDGSGAVYLTGATVQGSASDIVTVKLDEFRVASSVLATGRPGEPYSQKLHAAGGKTPYLWTLSSGSLPAGLVFDGATGTIAGSPTLAGTSTFTMQVTDAASTTVTGNLSLSVFGITTVSLHSGVTGTAYSQQLAAVGGSGSETWSLASGSLPAGITLSSGGLLSGNPGVAGSYAFTVRAGGGSLTATKELSLVIVNSLSIDTGALPSGGLGIAYGATLSGSGGRAPFNWSVTPGTLPAGLALSNSTGEISGQPRSSGSFTLAVQLMDADFRSVTRSIPITIAATCGLPPVRIAGSTPVYYSQLLAAYNAAQDGDILQTQSVPLNEELALRRPVAVQIRGGYDCGYSAGASPTVLGGTLRVFEGSVRIDRITFR